MATFIISYDINKEGTGYAAANKRLTDRIKEAFPTYWHHLDSTWIVVTDLTAAQIRDDLMRYIDPNDEVLVVKSGGVGAWVGIKQSGSDWLKRHL